MALCVRFYDEDTRTLREDFLGFAECQSTTGAALTDSFLENLRNMDIKLEKMRGQGYDGAANMSGRFKGVQSRIQVLYPGALYTHCKAHSLNLAIVHASKEHYARNMMGLVQTIAFAFNYSAKRMLCFQETLAEDPVSRNEMDHRTKLQSLCETRWASRADTLHTFLSAFTTVVRALHELATELEDTKAAAYRQGVLTFEFIVTLVAVEHILSAVVPLSKMLQKESCDLVQASVEAKVVIMQLDAERNDNDVWDALFGKAADLAAKVDIEPAIPRHVNRQQNRPNTPATTPSEFWRRNMYLPFADHLITQLQDRLLQAHGRFHAQYLIPSQVNNLTDEVVGTIHEEFLPDVDPDIEVFRREVGRWQTRWTAVTPERATKSLEQALGMASQDLYPKVKMCLAVLLSIYHFNML